MLYADGIGTTATPGQGWGVCTWGHVHRDCPACRWWWPTVGTQRAMAHLGPRWHLQGQAACEGTRGSSARRGAPGHRLTWRRPGCPAEPGTCRRRGRALPGGSSWWRGPLCSVTSARRKRKWRRRVRPAEAAVSGARLLPRPGHGCPRQLREQQRVGLLRQAHQRLLPRGHRRLRELLQVREPRRPRPARPAPPGRRRLGEPRGGTLTALSPCSVFEGELFGTIPVVHASIAGCRIIGRMCVGRWRGGPSPPNAARPRLGVPGGNGEAIPASVGARWDIA